MEKANMLLKVSGILMIIGGGISIIVGIIAVLAVGALALALGGAANLGLLTFGAILVLVSAVVELIAGIVGVSNAKKPEKAQTCVVYGILVVVLVVIGNIFSMIGGASFNALGLLIGLVLPALYLIGAFQNKKLAS